MHKMKLFVTAITLLALAGCSTPTPVTQNYSDLTACGNFPEWPGGHGGTNMYYVCRDSDDGSCYYKKLRQVDIEGCEYDKDQYPYGKPECLKGLADLYDANGKPTQSNLETDALTDDSCATTTQPYFKTKVSE